MTIHQKSAPQLGKKPLILIAVCTRNLAVFEANCARGIAQLSYPSGYRYELLVVENRREPSGALNPIGADIPVRYFLEKQLGLSAARNRVFAEAQKCNADWLALLDDDVVPMDSWLDEYVRAIQSMPDAKLLYGQYWYRFPNGYSLATERDPDSFEAMIEKPVRFGGGNLLMHRSLYSVHGVRFDPRFDGCGSEDTDLRRQAAEYGIDAVPVPRAVIQEEITTLRATLASGFHRKLDAGVSGIVMLKKYSSPLAFTVGVLMQLPRRLIHLLRHWGRVVKASSIRAENREEILDVAIADLAVFLGLIMGLCGYRGTYYSRNEE
ncbi:glycosyltransferase [Luminiphilus sp.]|nr:glycosyltransferase [Luminiphilus sp.]MDB4048772.1 glycosyltransferase [Luminiphilus sp.]MDC1116798.1 glycosyltransferase [Luminiphilus sp.]